MEGYQSRSGRLRVELYEKITLETRIVLGTQQKSSEQWVRVVLNPDPAKSGPPLACLDLPLLEFHELVYKRVFPSVARRIQKIL
jgi:hypothetical protein